MKIMITIYFLTISTIVLANSGEPSKVIRGVEAEAMFNQLNGFEYSAAAITEFIESREVVRHNDQISCQKEVTIYKNINHEDVQIDTQFECLIKP